MNATRKVKLNDITANLTCKLCLGYLVDATTIIECLHSFCKSCILKYLDKSADLEEKYCPVCDVQLHSTKPLTSIRSDLMLQEIVYKLVPGLFKNEMSRRREFYEKNPESTPTNQLDSGLVFDELYITSDDIIHLSLEYVTEDEKLRDNTKRYLKCPAAVSVAILKKFIQGKYDLDLGINIDIMFGDRILPDDFLLMDVAYKYSWTMNGTKPLTLRYRIKGQMKPKIKSEVTINDSSTTPDQVKAKPPDSPSSKKKVCNENGSNIMPSNVTKHNPIKIPGNGLISGEITIAPIKTPNGKVRGRKRKHLNFSDVVIVKKTNDVKNVGSKKMKFPKPESKQQQSSGPYPAIETLSSKDKSKNDSPVEAKEVQLHISENGVMSARSVPLSGNGEEKFILNLATSSNSNTTSGSNKSNSCPSPTTSQTVNPAEKLLLSGNFTSKTGPSGVTEIICDKPDPITQAMKPSAPKPGYVTLNIPNPSTSLLQRTSSASIGINVNSNEKKKIPVTKLLDSPSPSPTNLKRNGNLPSITKSSKSSLMEKIKSRIASKGKDGENVIKAISDLGKLCSSSSTSISTTTGTGSSSADNMTNSSGTLTNLSLSACPYSLSGQSLPPPKKKSANTLPFPLNFPPSSGMSVNMISMIPCTSNGSTASSESNNLNGTTITPQSTTPPKRISHHHTTVVNGDLKFTTSPKPQKILNGDNATPPKKPPKFFKSRHAPSPTTVVMSKQKPDKMETDLKRKSPNQVGNGTAEPVKKKVKDKSQSPKTVNCVSQSTSPNFPGCGVQSSGNFSKVSSTNGLQIPRPIPFPPQSNEKGYSQQVKGINGQTGTVSSTDVLNSSFGIAAAAAVAAAAANGNGSHPFTPEAYASMQYGYASLMSQLMLPQYYPISFSGAASSSLSLIKPKPSSPPLKSPSGNNGTSRSTNGVPKCDRSGPTTTTASTLDLSVGKNNDANEDRIANAEKNNEGKQSVLASLLNEKDKPGSKTESSSNSKELLAKPSPSNTVLSGKNGDKSRSTSPQNKKEELGNGHLESVKNGGTENGTNNKLEQRSDSNASPDKSDKDHSPSSGEAAQNGEQRENYVSNGGNDDVKEQSKSTSAQSPTENVHTQNNNNNNNNRISGNEVESKSEGESLSLTSTQTKVTKDMASAKQVDNEKGKCNGNNNNTTDINSNSGSA